MTAAQQQGQRWRDICEAVQVDRARIKAWQKAAQAQTSASARPLAMVPVQLAPQRAARITALVVRGLTVDDLVALVAAL